MPPLTWLITGTSSGLGLALVHELLSRGESVIATARNASSRLTFLKEAGAKILDLDVTATEDELKEKVEEEGGSEDWLKMLNTNLLGTINLTRAILPHFRQKKSGKLVFIGSENGWRAGAGNAAYSITKFALEASLAGDIDYGELAERVQAGLKASDGKQKGDPMKGAKVMVDIVKWEGVAEGRVTPRRMPLGAACWETVRGKCRETLELCDEWEGVTGSVDFDDGERSMSFRNVL
ncbi:NAD(P)-binding protein [Acephala macrosclerotiorum]|nr:NAD(P)-binding protein [Acephala macrosclerotiorum]